MWFNRCYLLLAIVTCVYGIFTTNETEIKPFDINKDTNNDEETSTLPYADGTDEANRTTSSMFPGDLALILKFPTPCETPNLEPAFCIELRKCPVLLKQVNNSKAWNFLRASSCGPDNEDKLNPKVCCGRHANFKNSTNKGVSSESKPKDDKILDDGNIFPKICGTQKNFIRGRIMGGTQAALGEFPWMARLIHKNSQGYKSFGCAGFLIHSKYVLTAAHCVKNKNIAIRGPLFSVVLGEHNTETKIDCTPKNTVCADPLQVCRISKTIVHSEYDPDSKEHYNDIALVHLKKGARITDYVRPLCLLTRPAEKPYKYTISGWGKTESEDFSKIKLKVDLQPFDHTECNQKYSLLNIELRHTQLCVGGEKGKDSCSGDSGGPLMMYNESVWHAAGIVSYGLGCGYEGWPGVYTNIPYYMSWIRKQIIINSVVNSKSSKTKRHKNQKKKDTSIKVTNYNNHTKSSTI